MSEDNPNRLARRASSIDVARAANVSQSAVSRTFTPGASVSPATRAKVLAAAEALGYRPNLLPRMLIEGQTRMVAVVAGGLANPFYARALDLLAQALRAAGRLVVLVRVDSDQALDEVVADLAGYRVDAVVSALSVRSEATARALAAIGIPIVQLAHGVAGDGIWTVNVDNEAAGRAAADLLVRRGGTRFGYIGGVDSPTQDRRERGFTQALAGHGFVPRRIVSPTYDHAGGAAAARELLAGGPVDALFCVNDVVACGAIDAARAMGLAVPGDLRVVGFDDIEQAGWPAYALTTFDQRLDELIAMVMEALPGDPAIARERLLAAPLVERASTL
jgi:DNA-binding LacI/PurR family transcriptional regulator